MSLIGSFVFILGLIVALAIANDIKTMDVWLTTVRADFILSTDHSDPYIEITSISTSEPRNSMSSFTDDMNITNPSGTIMTSATGQEGGSPTPLPSNRTTTTTSANTHVGKGTSPAPQAGYKNDKAGIIIFIVIILIAAGFGVACLIARKRGRRYSVAINSRPEEVTIPLSTVEPDMPADPTAYNGLQTFESTGTTKEPEEPAAKPEEQEEQRVDNISAEADKSVTDATAESAAPAPSPESPENKPKEQVAEQSLPAPARLSTEEKNDEDAISSNTSVEPNMNNSNNADFGQKRDLVSSKIFWDIALDCPV